MLAEVIYNIVFALLDIPHGVYAYLVEFLRCLLTNRVERTHLAVDQKVYEILLGQYLEIPIGLFLFTGSLSCRLRICQPYRA